MKIISLMCLLQAVFVLKGFFHCKKLLYIAYPNLYERDKDVVKALQVSLVLFMPIISLCFVGFAILFLLS